MSDDDVDSGSSVRPLNSGMVVTVATFHSFTVLSPLAETSRCPSGLNATQ